MSGFICPHCDCNSDLFSSGGGEALSKDLNIKFLGRIPIDPTLTTLMETKNFCETFIKSRSFEKFQEIVELLKQSINQKS
jgi:hypothetical protein